MAEKAACRSLAGGALTAPEGESLREQAELAAFRHHDARFTHFDA